MHDERHACQFPDGAELALLAAAGTCRPEYSDRPVFVVGERVPAEDLVRALGATPDLCAVPTTRLLRDLVDAVERGQKALAPLWPGADGAGPVGAAAWYRDVQASHALAAGKPRTVEFCGLGAGRLASLFPVAQIVRVQTGAGRRRPRPLASLPATRLMEVSTEAARGGSALAEVLSFLRCRAGDFDPAVPGRRHPPALAQVT